MEKGKEDITLHYVNYVQSKFSGYEQTDKRIPNRDISKIIFPDDCIMFNFYDKTMLNNDLVADTYDVIIDQKENVSNMYYIGEELTKADVARIFGVESELYDNMDELLADRVVKVRGNEYRILGKDDIVLSPSQIMTKSKASPFYNLELER